jgi:hypothetical protein
MPVNLSTMVVGNLVISLCGFSGKKKSHVGKAGLYTAFTQKTRFYPHAYAQSFLAYFSRETKKLYTQSTGLITVTSTYINKLIIRDVYKNLAY